MRCKRGEPMQSDQLDFDEELVEIDSDDDDETYEVVDEESSTEQSNDTAEEQAISGPPVIIPRSEIDDSYELQSIIGATHCDGEMHFLVQWTHSDGLEFVQSSLLNLKFPAQVIEFYEQRMRFVPNEQ